MYYLTDIMYRDKIRTVTNKNLMLEKPAQRNVLKKLITIIISEKKNVSKNSVIIEKMKPQLESLMGFKK